MRHDLRDMVVVFVKEFRWHRIRIFDILLCSVGRIPCLGLVFVQARLGSW